MIPQRIFLRKRIEIDKRMTTRKVAEKAERRRERDRQKNIISLVESKLYIKYELEDKTSGKEA